jgi:hypothetical protein
MRHFCFRLLMVLTLACGGLFGQEPSGPPSDPGLAMWREIKKNLQGSDSDNYFEMVLQHALVPGGANGVNALRGTVVSSKSADHPSEVVLAMSDTSSPEVTLRFVDQRGKEGHFKTAIPAGAKVAFAGIVKTFVKDPFMLGFEVPLGSPTDDTFTVILDTVDPSGPMPSISISYPSRTGDRFTNISLDGFPEHDFTVSDQGAVTKERGILLEKLLSTAGWYSGARGESQRPTYAVQIEGVQSTFRLTEVTRGSFDQRAWIVVNESVPSLMVVGADGAMIQRVDAIQRIRVYEQR